MWSPTHVQVVVQRARNVIAKGRNGTNDSYVVIQNGKEKFQTSVKEQSIDPIWHEECDLLIDSKDTDIIKLVLFHRNLFGLADEFLGQTSIPLKEFDIYERPKSRWYELEGRSNKKAQKYRGEIEVRVTFIVKNITNEKHKKRNSLVHQSLLDIRSALKSDNKTIDRNESRGYVIPGRKHSIADNSTKGSKQATRSISFKLEGLNARRKSLVDKFLRRHDSNAHEFHEKYREEVEEESQESSDFSVERNNGVICEEMSQSQEEVRELGRNSVNKIVIEVKNDINCEDVCNVDVNNGLKNDIKVKNDLQNDSKKDIKRDIKKDNEKEIKSVLDLKSSAWKPFKGSLKRALSTSNMFITSTGNTKPVPNLTRERSSTSGSDDNPSDILSQLHGRQNINNNNNIKISSSVVNDDNRVFRQSFNRERILSALKKSERRHTIDFEQILPNLKHPILGLEKRSIQGSPDSLYSSFESLLNRKQTKTDYHQKYEGLNKEELIQLIESQQLTILGLNEQINDLEDYIDNLLVRVIETSPRILQNSNYKLKSLYKI